MIIFVQFPDDSFDINNPYWPKGQAPTNASQWINQTWSINPIQGSLTHYFNDMSFNKFKLTGKTISVITPHSRQWYLNNGKNRGFINKEAILKVDSVMSFAEFDSLDLISEYNHRNQPDGIVDMIIMVYRNIANEFSIIQRDSIIQRLNFETNYGYLSGPEFTVDNGLRRVKTGFWPTPNGEPGGSGITEIDHLTRKNLSVTIHEFAHYLLGGNEMHSGYGAWAMLDDWGKKSKVANSFERYRLGWINVNTVDTVMTQTISSATLPDYVTTGIAYRLHINSSEGFYLENHQKLSYWENNNPFGVYGTSMLFGNIENGIYVFRQGGLYGNQLSILPADGRFNWVVNQFVDNPWGNSPDSLPVFKITSADRINGFHDLEPVQYYWNGQSYIDKIHFTENKFGQPQVDLRFLGDGKDAFRWTNEVFSPFSNPNSQRISKQSTPFGFKVNGFTNGVASIDIYVRQYLNAPPSRPTGLRIGKNSQYQAILEWSPNLEDDMKYNGKYKIYRADSNDGNEPSAFSLIATINAYNGTTPVNTFTDTDVFVGNGQAKLYYKISAVDNSNLESAMSLSDWINWDRNFQKSNEGIRITEFKLFDNYPNPFNPSTKISWQSPVSSWQTLKVYDVLGNEVATLVDEYREAGNYEVEFQSSAGYRQLASEIYFYRLQAGEFVQIKKMILAK